MQDLIGMLSFSTLTLKPNPVISVDAQKKELILLERK
jgi:hypothetical protein